MKKEKIHRGSISPVDPVFRIPGIAVNAEYLVERALTKFSQFERDRFEWMERREECYLGWDDYLSPTRKGMWEGSSNIHLPSTEIQCNAMHAKLMQAFFFIDPIFYVDPQEELDAGRVKKIELLMKYIVERYANANEGIYNAVDDWAWDLTTDGVGIFSRDWKIEQRRFVSIEENSEYKSIKNDLQNLLIEDIDQNDFDLAVKEMMKFPYREVSKVRTVTNGPVLVAEDPCFILFKGDVVDSTDLSAHETIIKVCYFTKDELISFANSSFFDKECVEKILESGPDIKGGSVSYASNSLNYAKDRITGVRTMNADIEEDRYEFLLVWDKCSLSGKSVIHTLNDRVSYYVHPKSKSLPRWTFIDRISATGKLPLHMAHLYRRPRRSTGRGIVETQFALNEVQDVFMNQMVDAGTLANNPMFAWRGNSSFDPEEVRVGPGIGIKTDDPNNDIRFFDWKVNSNWAIPLLGFVGQFQQGLTSIGAEDTGQIGNRVGAMRSTSGVRELGANKQTQHDVLIKRAKKCLSSAMEGMYYDTVDRMPDKLKISARGAEGVPLFDQDGKPIFSEVTKAEARARVHFGLYANSQNMNRLALQDSAMKQAQFLLQRINLDTGVVTPQNVYEIMDYVMSSMGTMNKSRFITKPAGGIALPMQAEIMLIMQGIKPPVVLNDPEHEIKIGKYMELLESDGSKLEQESGMIHPSALSLLQGVISEHQRFLETVKRPTNMGNVTGQQINPALGGNAADNGGGGDSTGGMDGEIPMEE